MRERGSTAPRHFLFCQALFLKMLKSAWESAEVNDTFLPGSFFYENDKKCLGKYGGKLHFCMKILKVPGNVRK